MRRKLWLLLILSLSIVGRESCCASQEQPFFTREELAQALQEVQQSGGGNSVLDFILPVCFTSLGYLYFDLHQKKKGWYTCKFYYAAGYRTKLFYNRIYLDFYSSFFKMTVGFLGAIPSMIVGLYRGGLLGIVVFSFFININIRIYRDFYIVIPIPVLPILISVVILIATLSKKNKTHSFL